MRFFLTLLLLTGTLTSTLSSTAQEKRVKFYGFVRGDLFYNSRANAESFDGAFLLYPLNSLPDENGKDLNAVSNSGFFMMTTRVGVNLTGPQIFGARTSANVEGDFAGFSGGHSMVRLRHANIKFDWNKGSSLLFGQTWHPLFGDIMPRIMNVSTGAPFQPFSRTPQLRYQYTHGRFSATAAAIYQFQFMSAGPQGKTLKYTKNAIVPELFASVGYKTDDLLLSAAVDVLTMRPRTQTEVDGKTYKVSEKLTTPSFMVAGRYKRGLTTVAAKSVYGQNLTHVTLNGGFGVSHINDDHSYDYTPFKTITSWVNFTYGEKFQGGVFLGHTQNLGTTNPLVDSSLAWGSGIDIDKLLYASAQFSYNIPSFTVGLEYALSRAYYGKINTATGRINNSLPVDNHRLLLMVCYFF